MSKKYGSLLKIHWLDLKLNVNVLFQYLVIFTSNEETYLQLIGATMGTSPPSYANIFMAGSIDPQIQNIAKSMSQEIPNQKKTYAIFHLPPYALQQIGFQLFSFAESWCTST